MATIETRDEGYAVQAASDAYEDADGLLFPEGRQAFRAGWLAGRDWARLQENRRLMDCQHITPCTSSESCSLKTEA